MRSKFFTGEGTIEERLDYTERSLQRLDRRIGNKVEVHIPPILVHCFIDELVGERVVLRFLAPTSGRLGRLLVCVDAFTGDSKILGLEIIVSGQMERVHKDISVTDSITRVMQDIPLSEGSRIEIVVRGSALGIWISGLVDIDSTCRKRVKVDNDESSQA